MQIPEPNNTITHLIDASHEAKAEKPRLHLGCSQIGHPCERWLWLSFRWAAIEKFSGRMLRLFRRGQMEEETVVADLRLIGCDVQSTGDNQTRVNFGKHVSGSIDGIIASGVPESPTKKHLLEVKTHSAKSFAGLLKDGVEKSKPQHYVQMQMYMAGTNTDRALYYAVNKDTDEVYTERVKFNKDVALWAIERGHRVTMSERMPPPLSTDPSWYQCKFCAGRDVCFGDKLTKEVNCRTCALSTPTEDSKWTCGRYGNVEIPGAAQQQGCECHVLHPDLVPFKMIGSDSEFVAVYEIDGQQFRNGEPCANVLSSKEIIAGGWRVANDAFVKDARQILDARIVDTVKDW